MSSHASTEARTTRPRVGFLGVGWIGRNRMEAIAASGAVSIAAVADASRGTASAASHAAGEGTAVVESLDDLLAMDLEALVIATPSAMHADQAIAALERGLAVFCQKPLGRNARETRAVVDAARRANRLLGVDLSYRTTAAAEAIRSRIVAGAIGRVHAIDLTFHNAYGPDKAWFYDRALSGGGCVIDLGIHLVDLALWTLGFPEVNAVSSRLYARGRLLAADPTDVEDLAYARLDLEDGAVANLACSWRLHAGRPCVIEAAFHGSDGGLALRNVGGSFYDFRAELSRGTTSEPVADPPDAWSGRAAVDWARRLAADRSFDPSASRLVDVATALDLVYGRME